MPEEKAPTKEKAEVKKKPASKMKPASKKKPDEKTEEKAPKELDDETLQQLYEEETGKHAIWRGKQTKGYEEWKKEKLS